MEEHTNALKGYLQDRRNCKRTIYKIMGTIYRGVNKGRFTLNEGLTALEKLPRKDKSICKS